MCLCEKQIDTERERDRSLHIQKEIKIGESQHLHTKKLHAGRWGARKSDHKVNRENV